MKPLIKISNGEGKPVEKWPVETCWDCGIQFDPYEAVEGGETVTEDRFCSNECRSNWMSENREEFN